jgi:hypothetical protein
MLTALAERNKGLGILFTILWDVRVNATWTQAPAVD